jgi:hypothetical protein
MGRQVALHHFNYHDFERFLACISFGGQALHILFYCQIYNIVRSKLPRPRKPVKEPRKPRPC